MNQFLWDAFFPGGPTSQHDTIELRGFEDIPEEQMSRSGAKKSSQSQAKPAKISMF